MGETIGIGIDGWVFRWSYGMRTVVAIEKGGYAALDWSAITRKQWDNISVWYKTKDERPIVFGHNYVRGVCKWGVKQFYTDLNAIIRSKANSVKLSRWHASRRWDGGSWAWGCRTFTRKDLLEIRRLMKWHYTPKQLGIKG